MRQASSYFKYVQVEIRKQSFMAPVLFFNLHPSLSYATMIHTFIHNIYNIYICFHH